MTVFIKTKEGTTFRVSKDGSTWADLVGVYTENDRKVDDNNVLAIPADLTKFVEVEYTCDGVKNSGALSLESDPMNILSTNSLPIDGAVYLFNEITY